jgi:hypothetical protein
LKRRDQLCSSRGEAAGEQERKEREQMMSSRKRATEEQLQRKELGSSRRIEGR